MLALDSLSAGPEAPAHPNDYVEYGNGKNMAARIIRLLNFYSVRSLFSLIALLYLIATPALTLAVTPTVAAGDWHSVGLKSDGTVWAWGRNNLGQLGDGSTSDSPTPKQVGVGYTAVAAGADSTFAIKPDGSLWAWGDNSLGQYGDGSNIGSLVPKQIGTGFAFVTSANGRTFAIKTDGSLWASGLNNGRLGDGTDGGNSLVFVHIGDGFSAVSSGMDHTVGLKQDGTLWSWGLDDSGEIGDGCPSAINPATHLRYAPPSYVPKMIGSGYTAIAAGWDLSIALKADGSLWGWGAVYNNGVSEFINCYPTQLDTGFKGVTAGSDNQFVLKSDGSILGWGLNTFGQLGDGTTTNNSAGPPKKIDTGYVSIFAGANSTFGLKADGSLWGCRAIAYADVVNPDEKLFTDNEL